MTPVVLATDALLWLLVAAVLIYALYCRRRPHLAAPWKRVFQSQAAVVSGVVLACYLVVGLADSLHYRAAGSVEVRSLLDRALAVLRERSEKTYSAPLREYPRLRHGGSHLQDELERWSDIALRAAAGLAGAAALWGVLFLMSRPLARRYPHVPFSAAWITLAVILGVAGPIASLAPHYHVLGTNQVGQDVLYLALKSIRTSLAIGTLTTLVLLPLGIALGIMAGYFKGWIDDAIQYLYTTLNSIPGVLLIAAAVLMMQVVIDRHAEWFPTAAQRADFRLLVLCAILGLTSWTGLARLLRGEALKLSQLEYIQAAHAFGVSDTRILGRHILPNVSHIVIIAMVMDFSGLVLAEAVLSYVGVGVDPATTSFGTMINSARLEMGREPIVWWSLAAAFVFMFVLVLAANLFADAVRDGFDPRVRVGALAV
jgi:peptide/nickel transport system permease protein